MINSHFFSALEEKRFLYVMLNKRNGLCKIGLSIDAVKRERTLQGEEPEVELIKTFKGGFELERMIHSHFAEKRVRGEWFRLEEGDILIIEELFSNCII